MKTCHGSCHCGSVRFEADIDLGAGTIKCNCTICNKMRFSAAQVPSAAFRLLAGADVLREYRYHTRRDAHYFCGNCGINTFSTGDSCGAIKSAPQNTKVSHKPKKFATTAAVAGAISAACPGSNDAYTEPFWTSAIGQERTLKKLSSSYPMLVSTTLAEVVDSLEALNEDSCISRASRGAQML